MGLTALTTTDDWRHKLMPGRMTTGISHPLWWMMFSDRLEISSCRSGQIFISYIYIKKRTHFNSLSLSVSLYWCCSFTAWAFLWKDAATASLNTFVLWFGGVSLACNVTVYICKQCSDVQPCVCVSTAQRGREIESGRGWSFRETTKQVVFSAALCS